MTSPFGWNGGPIAASPNHVTLERLKVGVAHVVGESVAQSLRLDVDQDPVFGRIVYRLTAQVLAESLPPESVSKSVTVTWPQWATWWDHFKAMHAGRWWVRRWPPRTVQHACDATVTVDLRKYITYPMAPAVRSEFGDAVRAATWDTSTVYGPITEVPE